MQTHDTLFTPTEAAVLTGLPLKAVNNAIDRKTVSAIAGQEGGRLLDARALMSLSIERRLSDRGIEACSVDPSLDTDLEPHAPRLVPAVEVQVELVEDVQSRCLHEDGCRHGATRTRGQATPA